MGLFSKFKKDNGKAANTAPKNIEIPDEERLDCMAGLVFSTCYRDHHAKGMVPGGKGTKAMNKFFEQSNFPQAFVTRQELLNRAIECGAAQAALRAANDLDRESEHRAAAEEVLITDGGMTEEEAKYTVSLMLDVLLNSIKLGTLK